MDKEQQRTEAVVRWATGVAIPLVLLGLGLYAVINRVSLINFGSGGLEQNAPSWGLKGTAAVVNGISLIALGLGLHLQFWKWRLSGHAWRRPRRILARAATALIIGAVVIFFVSQFLPGQTPLD